LVPVKDEVLAEEPRSFGKNDAFARKCLQIGSALECRIELEDRVGPQATLMKLFT